MSRLKDLDIRVGRVAPGPMNAITDVAGVRVGHADVSEGGLLTGLTAVFPYPAEAGKRRLFVGRWFLDGGAAMSGLAVAEDFGTFSSPIVLAPAPAAGRVYNGLITYGQKRDKGLPIDGGWPPVVIGVDDGFLNDRTAERRVGEADLDRCFAQAGREVGEGSAGIGRGLCAFGLRGGVGTASRKVGDYGIGVLVAANGGERDGLRINGFPVGRFLDLPGPDGERPRSVFAVVATDAPLLSGQLDRLVGRMTLGLARGGFLDAHTQAGGVLAFSTSNALVDGEKVVQRVRMAGEEDLASLFEASAEAAEEAGLNALLAADSSERLASLTPERLLAALKKAKK